MRLSKSLQDYQAGRGRTRPWEIAGDPVGSFTGAVVIPSLAESEVLFATLESVGTNPTDFLDQFLILVVINHREDASPEDKSDNFRTLGLLEGFRQANPHLRLAWVDAASPGKELPTRGGGVGLARKIGFDLALPHLSASQKPVLVALDADTLVLEDYLPAIVAHFRSTVDGGAVIPFCHRPACGPRHSSAITTYELFLRSYVLGLSLASSPYAFHTVGSAMACTVEAYLKMGGMNTRAAGEDFYFLQQLYRTSGVSQVQGTVVHPSPRSSHRVPFGTGRSISRQLTAQEEVLFYRPECFQLLKGWLETASRIPEIGVEGGMDAAAQLSPYLSGYLQQIQAKNVLTQLRRHNPSGRAFIQAFHTWFDGLKTMKLIHHLSTFLPRCSPEESVPVLLSRDGIEPDSAGVDGWLFQLRQLQNGCSCSLRTTGGCSI